MTESPHVSEEASGSPPSPIETVDKSYRWYATHAWRGRVGYWGSESALLVVAASIPAAAAFTSDRRVPALLGAVVVVLTGLRPIFRWREDWLRFTQACNQLLTERDLYTARADEYAGDDRDVRLIRRIRDIETAETAGWVNLRRGPSQDSTNEVSSP